MAELSVFETRSDAIGSTITTSLSRIRILRYAAGSPFAPAFYRLGSATGPLAFQDASGHWWELDVADPDLVLKPEMFGAVGDGVAYDDAPLRAMNAVLSQGVCKKGSFKGSYRVYATVPDTTNPLFQLNAVHDLHFDFSGATFICNADQSALRSGQHWAQNFFYFLNCRNFRGAGIPQFIGNWTKTTIKDFGSAYGMLGLQFEGNCSGVKIDGAYGQGILEPVALLQDIIPVKFSNDRTIVANQGSGYTLGDVVTVVGGTGSTSAIFNVDGVGPGGGVTSLSILALGTYPSGQYPTIGASETGYALTGGTGAGARVIAYMERASDVSTVGGHLGRITARECFYALNLRNSGDYVTAEVDADYCYRATFAYGDIRECRIATVVRHVYRTAMPCGQAQQPLGMNNCYLSLKVLPLVEDYGTSDCIIRPSFNSPWPTRVSVHIDVDADYGAGAARPSNLLEISKYNLGSYDDTARGHDLSLRLTGRIRGKSLKSSNGPAGTHFSMAGWTWLGEYFSSLEMSLDIEGGGDIVVDPRAFPSVGLPFDTQFVQTKSGIHFDVVNPDGYVTVNTSLTGLGYYNAGYSRTAITVSPRSRFLNRHCSVGALWATVGAIDTTDSITLLPGWHDFSVGLFGNTSSVSTRTLPAKPFKGLRYLVKNYNSGVGVVRIVPQTGQAFLGHAAGKYLELAVGAVASIECIRNVLENGADVWIVVSSSGSITYQP